MMQGQPYCYDRNAGPLPPQPARVDAAAGRPVDEISDEELAAMIMEELVEEVREEMNAKSKGRWLLPAWSWSQIILLKTVSTFQVVMLK